MTGRRTKVITYAACGMIIAGIVGWAIVAQNRLFHDQATVGGRLKQQFADALDAKNREMVTYANFSKLQSGMSRYDCEELLAHDWRDQHNSWTEHYTGARLVETNGGREVYLYAGQDPESWMKLTFDDRKLSKKEQSGLK